MVASVYLYLCCFQLRNEVMNYNIIASVSTLTAYRACRIFLLPWKVGSLTQYSHIRFGEENVVDILYKDSLKDEKNELTVYVVKLPRKKTRVAEVCWFPSFVKVKWMNRRSKEVILLFLSDYSLKTVVTLGSYRVWVKQKNFDLFTTDFS